MVVTRQISLMPLVLWLMWLSSPLLYALLNAYGVFQPSQIYQPVPIPSRKHFVTRANTPYKNGSTDGLVLAGTNETTHRSSQDGVTNKPLDYEIVISHYNENLDWTKPLANHSHVYHKGEDNGPPFDVYKWEKLPNVGREAHTYLYHIIITTTLLISPSSCKARGPLEITRIGVLPLRWSSSSEPRNSSTVDPSIA